MKQPEKGTLGLIEQTWNQSQSSNKTFWKQLDYECSQLLNVSQEKQTVEANLLLSSSKMYSKVFQEKALAL